MSNKYIKKMKADLANQEAIRRELEQSDEPILKREAERLSQQSSGLKKEIKSQSRTPCRKCGGFH